MDTTIAFPDTSCRDDHPPPTAAGERDDRVHQSQKMEAIGCLTGRFAHDFSNLLQVIAGYADVIQALVEGGSTDLGRIGRASESIRAATDQAAGLTRHLLDYSSENGADGKSTDLNAVVDDTRRTAGFAIGEAVEMRSIPTSDLWTAMADREQIGIALLALLRNAREALPAGGLITLETENLLIEDRQIALGEGVAAGRYVVLTVSDTGTGMPPEVLVRAMEPFFTTREPQRERGLGLTLVDGFARRSGGAARISSVVGRGTTVRILLPAGD